jgi:D-alanyl-lipoteichoic acid acyltransferase DltB (MBOAT superfamily)
MENFKQPFFANSLTTFWAKWHISLMNWFRDYIMFPLVKKGHAWQFVFLLVFILSGFWHGASWTFVLWGIFNGLMVIYTKSTQKIRKEIIEKIGLANAKSFRNIIQSICVFHIFAFSGIFFRAKNISDAFLLIKNLFSGISDNFLSIINNSDNARESLLYLGQNPISFYLLLLFLVILFVFDWLTNKMSIDDFFNKIKIELRYLIYIIIIFVIILMSNVPQTDFVYFQF